jgi:hypothetical protein
MHPVLNDPNSLPAVAPRAAAIAPRPTLAIRELSKLIADIRMTRLQFQEPNEVQAPVPLEMVVGNDPRD